MSDNLTEKKRRPNAEDHDDQRGGDATSELLRTLVAQAGDQSSRLSSIQDAVELDVCVLEKIARIVCMNTNEAHQQTLHLTSLTETLSSFLELYKSAHPAAALEVERLARVRAEMLKCCPPEKNHELICHYQPCQPHGGILIGDGWSTKSKGFVNAAEIDEHHAPWVINAGTLNENEEMPRVPQGPIVGQLVPAKPTPRVLDFRNGGVTAPGGQEPVTFRTFTNGAVTQNVWPPDMSGAKAGDVVLMSGNLWLKLSVDGGKTFKDLDFTKLFAADTTYGGWSGDQVVHYVPSIDCFVLYVQSRAGTGNNLSKSIVKVALASPDDLKKFSGGKQAWRRQWNFTSDDFGLGFWLDFPDLSYGDAFLYVATNVFARTADAAGKTSDSFQGRLFFELPLRELKAGVGFNYQYALINERLTFSSPTQNIGDENYWSAHIDNATMRIYSSKGGDANFFWRERKLSANWPTASNSATVKPEDNEDDVKSASPDSPDWISEDHRIIGVTRVASQIWFAWTAAPGDGGGGGFKFPQAHIQIAKFDVAQDYKLVEQTQVWNADHAYAYPSLTTNSNFEVGISLAWGGGKFFGSHAVGILGDFVVWFGEASDKTSSVLSPTRFGDYVHVRLAHPDTRFFSAFGYAVKNDTSTSPPKEKADYLYVEFGREPIAPSPLR